MRDLDRFQTSSFNLPVACLAVEDIGRVQQTEDQHDALQNSIVDYSIKLDIF